MKHENDGKPEQLSPNAYFGSSPGRVTPGHCTYAQPQTAATPVADSTTDAVAVADLPG